jgi:hypothetical protein
MEIEMAQQFKSRDEKKAEREEALKDYVMVHERIQKFKEEYPDGSLQAEILDITDDYVLMKAYAYRFPEDPRPSVGHAHEVKDSNFINKYSMVENAETSAWGRALAALGFEIKKGIASAEEIQNAKRRQAEAESPDAKPVEEVEAEAKEREELMGVYQELTSLHKERGVSTTAEKKKLLVESGIAQSFTGITVDQLKDYARWLKEGANAGEEQEGYSE